MIPITRSSVSKTAKEADRIPADTLVIGMGFIDNAEHAKVFCKTCKRQLTESDSIDAEVLLAHSGIHPASDYAAMMVVPVAEIQALADAVPSEKKCHTCGTVGKLRNQPDMKYD